MESSRSNLTDSREATSIPAKHTISTQSPQPPHPHIAPQPLDSHTISTQSPYNLHTISTRSPHDLHPISTHTHPATPLPHSLRSHPNALIHSTPTPFPHMSRPILPIYPKNNAPQASEVTQTHLHSLTTHTHTHTTLANRRRPPPSPTAVTDPCRQHPSPTAVAKP